MKKTLLAAQRQIEAGRVGAGKLLGNTALQIIHAYVQPKYYEFLVATALVDFHYPPTYDWFSKQQ